MTVRRMRISCWLPKTTNTKIVSYLLFFHCNNVCTNAPQCHVIPTLPALSLFIFIRLKAGEYFRKAAMLFFYSLQIYQAYHKRRCTFSKIYCHPLLQVPKIVASVMHSTQKTHSSNLLFVIIVRISNVGLGCSSVA